jgi:uncharacterized protein YcfL
VFSRGRKFPSQPGTAPNHPTPAKTSKNVFDDMLNAEKMPHNQALTPHEHEANWGIPNGHGLCKLQSTDFLLMTTRRQIVLHLFAAFSLACSSLHAQAPAAIHYKFDVTSSRDKVDSKTKGVMHTKVITNQYVTHIKITNSSGQAVSNLEVQYQIYWADVQGTATIVKHKDGKHVIPFMKSLETVVVDTVPVSLDSKQISAGYHYTSGAPGRQIDSFKGIAVTFLLEGKQVFEYVADGIKKAPQESGTQAPPTPRKK